MTHTLVVCKPKLPDQYLTQRVDLKRQLDQMHSGEVMYFPVFELVPDLNAMARIRPWIDNATEKANRLIVFVSPSVLEIAVTNLGQWPANVYCAVMGRQSAKLASDRSEERRVGKESRIRGARGAGKRNRKESR